MPMLCTRNFLFACLLITGLKGYSQDTTITILNSDSIWKINFDPAWHTGLSVTISPFSSFDFYLNHSPEKKDCRNYRRYKRYLNRKPNAKNHHKYFSLAYSLWELNKLAEAEQMFLAVVESEDEFYRSTYYNSSDIPGDTTTNIYGYGSSTSNYKNEAAIYLTKIYLEQKQFDKALKYLEDAVNKYPVTYTCGTGYNWQRNKYDFLYASCYLGLNRNKEVINLLLPKCLERSDEMIVEAIKNSYTEKEIDAYLTEAENSIECTLDTTPSYFYQAKEGSNCVEMTDSVEYYSGSATILLFGQKLDMPLPAFTEKGDRLTRDWFIKRYKESDFYSRLGKKDEDNSSTAFD